MQRCSYIFTKCILSFSKHYPGLEARQARFTFDFDLPAGVMQYGQRISPPTSKVVSSLNSLKRFPGFLALFLALNVFKVKMTENEEVRFVFVSGVSLVAFCSRGIYFCFMNNTCYY